MKRENRLLGKCGVFAWEFDADALYITFFSSYYSSPPEKKLYPPVDVLYTSLSSNLSLLAPPSLSANSVGSVPKIPMKRERGGESSKARPRCNEFPRCAEFQFYPPKVVYHRVKSLMPFAREYLKGRERVFEQKKTELMTKHTDKRFSLVRFSVVTTSTAPASFFPRFLYTPRSCSSFRRAASAQ